MIKVYVKRQNYPVNTKRIKTKLKEFFSKQGIVSDAVVSVSFVGSKAMQDIARKYLKEKRMVHNVLSFPESEARSKFVNPPDLMIRLGEIVVCYAKVVEEAKEEEKLIDDKVDELVEHGAMHLMGIHHN